MGRADRARLRRRRPRARRGDTAERARARLARRAGRVRRLDVARHRVERGPGRDRPRRAARAHVRLRLHRDSARAASRRGSAPAGGDARRDLPRVRLRPADEALSRAPRILRPRRRVPARRAAHLLERGRPLRRDGRPPSARLRGPGGDRGRTRRGLGDAAGLPRHALLHVQPGSLDRRSSRARRGRRDRPGPTAAPAHRARACNPVRASRAPLLPPGCAYAARCTGLGGVARGASPRRLHPAAGGRSRPRGGRPLARRTARDASAPGASRLRGRRGARPRRRAPRSLRPLRRPGRARPQGLRLLHDDHRRPHGQPQPAPVHVLGELPRRALARGLARLRGASGSRLRPRDVRVVLGRASPDPAQGAGRAQPLPRGARRARSARPPAPHPRPRHAVHCCVPCARPSARPARARGVRRVPRPRGRRLGLGDERGHAGGARLRSCGPHRGGLALDADPLAEAASNRRGSVAPARGPRLRRSRGRERAGCERPRPDQGRLREGRLPGAQSL